MALITLEEAVTHLRIDDAELLDTDFLLDLQAKIDGASSMCLRYVNLPEGSFEDSAGLPVNVPNYLKSAVKIWLGVLFKHRDGTSDETLTWGQIPVAVSSILVQYRVPPIA